MIRLDIVGVDSEGFVDVSKIASLLSKDTALVTVMHSNNEIGTIQPIREISKLLKSFYEKNDHRILLHTGELLL